ncbi:Efflux pump himE [Pseudocercospora fuligena]|uniref:Efflux pump himE n=1 Tax=Pseudocercospora fuligena TaxID=685502 RepID=A0A8H6RE98_9PEZI|nr:Efflux pump himE [Pseudocercospora fuligena]
MSVPFLDCTSLTPECPVEATIYGYRPSLPANALFLTLNLLCALFSLIFGIRYRTWTYMLGLTSGVIIQSIGYIGRILMYINPWNTTGFTIQIALLIIGPAFISASIYLTLKHFVLAFGERYSILKAKFYTWGFITADVISIVLQAAGGAIAASGQEPDTQQLGGDVMLAGIVWQVVSLAGFGGLGSLYFVRVLRNREELSGEQIRIAKEKKFRAFLVGIGLAYTTILIRCIYRIPELASGWRGELMRCEVDFVVLDSVMTAVAVVVLTFLHPGFCFPAMANEQHSKREIATGKSLDESESTSEDEGAARGKRSESV